MESLITAFLGPLDFEEKDERSEKERVETGKKEKGKKRRREKMKTWASEPKGNDTLCIIKNVGAKLKSRVQIFFACFAHQIVTYFKNLKLHLHGCFLFINTRAKK